jgi:predicted small lipoprotein YifL
MKTKFALAVALLLVWLIAGCDPKGSPCNRVGDAKASGGHTYTCQKDRNGSNTWQKIG